VCLAGAWAANVGNETGSSSSGNASSLSPGDLDEAISALVASRSGNVDRGSAFDRVAAFRKGFHNGPSACVQSSPAKSAGQKSTGQKSPGQKSPGHKTTQV